MNYNNILKNLTIVIPSYNRQSYLIRIIKYWSNKKVKIIILDGSKNSLKRKIKIIGKNIVYIHNPVGLYSRLLSSSKKIQTKYVMLGCDDEFYIPSALTKCLKFLSLNKNYGCCTGRALGFNYKNGKVYGYSQYSKLKNLELNNSDPNKRIKKHFLNYVPSHLYSICTAEIWKIAAKTIFSKEYNFYAAWELQFEFLVLFYKKSKVLPNLLWLRSRENDPIRENSPSMSFSKPFSDWWIEKKYEKEKKEFIFNMNKACKQINRLNGNKIKPNTEISFQYFYESNYKNIHFFKKKIFLPTYKLVLNILKFSSFSEKILKRIHKLFKFKSQFSNDASFDTLIKSFEKESVKVDKKELKKIEKYIIFFHTKNKLS